MAERAPTDAWRFAAPASQTDGWGNTPATVGRRMPCRRPGPRRLLAPTIVEVTGRYVFYNQLDLRRQRIQRPKPYETMRPSPPTSNRPTARPDGRPSGFANYTSYSQGINGIMVDFAGTADQGVLNIAATADYFEFHAGNNDDTADLGGRAETPTRIYDRPNE